MVEAGTDQGQEMFWRRTLLGLCLCLWLIPSANSTETVQSLRYGTTLFSFFQQDYYTALTELMVAQRLQQLGPHKDRGELLRGGMSLSYGMDKVAEQTFASLLGGEGELQRFADRERAWFYLAKMAWQRGDIKRGKAALEHMDVQESGPYSGQADYLRSSIALREGDVEAARAYAARLPLDSPWRYYLYYNLGASEAALGQWDAAVESFAEFDQMDFPTSESKQVHDKALTASGFALMAADEFEAAQSQFTRVRLDSPMADRALLGYGWAASEMGNFNLALSSWQTLSGRELGSPSARESLLAIPYAYEKLGRAGLALENYRRAANAYLVQLSTVREAKAEFGSGNLGELLELGVTVPGSGGDGHGWVFGQDILPLGSHSRLLSQLLSKHSFQLALRELQDLYRIAWHLDNARKRLQNLAQVDADQQASWASVTEGGRRDKLQRQQEDLLQKISSIRRRLAQAESAVDGPRLLADVQQTSLWEKLDSASDILARLPQSESTAGQRAQLSLMRGLMSWQASEQYVARSWTLQRQVDQLKALASESTVLLERVDEAIARRGEHEFSQRIAAMNERLSPHSQRVDAAIVRSEAQLRQVAIAELEKQEQQISRALGRSRLAIARLYDQSSAEVVR